MSDSTVISLRQPDEVDDPLTAVLRKGARRLLAQAIEAEADAFLETMKGVQLPDGRDRLVRHGHGPERLVQTGIGPVAVQRVRLRDRGAGENGERIRFTSAILPRWARRTRSLDALLPILYLRGVSMGDFGEALAALLGNDAPNLSPSVIARLRGEWEADYARWQRRDLSARRYVYGWADGVYLQARMEPQAECWCGRVRRETGRRLEVRVLYGEGIASHTGPESCATVREGRGEALTGECVGQPLSGENQLRGADVLRPAEGNTARVVNARRSPTPRRRRTWHAQTPSAREPGDLQAVRVGRHADRVGKAGGRSRR
jgi:hypothetical protein